MVEVFSPPAGVSASALTAPDNPLTLARCQPSTAKHGRTMRSITITATAAAACALLLQPAYAQDSASSPSRAEVKAQTRAANEAGALAPAGPLGPEREPKAAKSNKARAPVKAETRRLNEAGQLAPAGSLGPEREPKAAKSNKARAPVKAETREAVKAGTIPRGEAPTGAK